MADDEIDVEGDFDLKTELSGDFYDDTELPSKSANLLPEFTSPAWMLEQGWSLDGCMDEKSKATIEKMLLEEQQYMYGTIGRKNSRYLSIELKKNVMLVSAGTSKCPTPNKSPWTQEEKATFLRGMGIFGRSWTKIASLIPTRTSLQVKNYAQQYMKNLSKTRSETDVPGKEATISSTVGSHSNQALQTDLEASLANVATAQPTVSTFSLSGTKRKQKATISPSKRKTNAKLSKEFTVNESISNSIFKKEKKTIDKQRKKKNMKKTIKLNKELLANGGNIPHTIISYSDMTDKTAGANQEADLITFDKSQRCIVPSDVTKPERTEMSNTYDGTAQSLGQGVQQGSSQDAEDDDLDIDIENDDEENVVLQSRSASPSSVYKHLLESACIKSVNEKKDVEHDVPPQNQNVIDISKGAVSSADCKSEIDKDAGTNSVDLFAGEETSQMFREDEEETEHHVKTDTIVNGLLSATGEIIEFDVPLKEKIIEPCSILEEEKSVHSDFFDGRAPKTPERYIKIRNYIIDSWLKIKPTYLNKTSIRTGLKNCGDVNCIGRIHSYLECVGAINFGCDQAAYKNPSKVLTGGPNSRVKVINKDLMSALTVKTDSIRPRKRRIRDDTGLWVDERELEGKTINHNAENKKNEGSKKSKGPRVPKPVYDPFKLVPCLPFSEENKPPYGIEMFSTALAVMDIHAHISKTEVIGMLGGKFCHDTGRLTVSMAVPCKSMSTGMQCEMDPVSQTLASEQIEDVGMQVVGWYHSHPTFSPDPSVRDIETQQKFQYWFSKGGNHFVGVIISPYNSRNPSVNSDIRCLTISDTQDAQHFCNVPYKFAYEIVYRDNLREILGPASDLADKYSNYINRVMLSCQYRASHGISCLTKMLQSVKRLLLPEERKVDKVTESTGLTQWSPAVSSMQQEQVMKIELQTSSTQNGFLASSSKDESSQNTAEISTKCQHESVQSFKDHDSIPTSHISSAWTQLISVPTLTSPMLSSSSPSTSSFFCSKTALSLPLRSSALSSSLSSSLLITSPLQSSSMIAAPSVSSSSPSMAVSLSPLPINKCKVDEVLHWLEQIFLDKFTQDTPRSPPIGSLSSLERAKP